MFTGRRFLLRSISSRTMVTSSSRAKDLRPSASLVVVNSSNEVLLVHRNPNATSFAGMHVFPGGNYDEKQDESYQMTAIRETFEETGLLLASEFESELPQQSPPSPSPSPSLSEAALDASRESIHAGRTLFRDFLKQHALSADVKALLPFTEWITPLGYPRRFHTRFYVAFLPSQAQALRTSGGFSSFSSGRVTQHRLPTPDGGQEVVEARFVHPREALAEHRSKKIALMPPQHYILTTLADLLLVGRQTTPRLRERVEQLSVGAFGRMVICPQAGKRDANGRTPLVYEGDEARGGPRGHLHRSIVLFSPETKHPTEIELLRNFDIFTQAESGATTLSTKL
ncbi:NUDIX hydrolase domain-like protein [Russula decolorans]